MTKESSLAEDDLAKRIEDFAASFVANRETLADLAPISNPNLVATLAEVALSDRGDGFACMSQKIWLLSELRIEKRRGLHCTGNGL